MTYDLVGAMEFAHQITGKLAEFTNAELVVLVAGGLLIAKATEHSNWFKRILKRVGYLE